MRVTAELLRSKGACEGQIATFAAEWPDGVELTRKALRRAAELELDLGWAARALLTPGQWAAYEAARATAEAAYEAAIATAWAAYEAATAPARAAYRAARADAFWAAVKVKEV